MKTVTEDVLPKDGEVPGNYGGAQTCPRYRAGHTRSGCHHSLCLARDLPRQSHLLHPFRAAVLVCVLKKYITKYTFILRILLGCYRREKGSASGTSTRLLGTPASGSQSSLCSPTSLLPAYVLQEQIHVTKFSEDINRNMNLFSWSEKNEHCQHMFTGFYWGKKKKTPPTPNQLPSFKPLFCRTPVLL